MTNAETYRATAAAMRRRAAAAGTPEHRAAWARMAKTWDALADDVEACATAADAARAPEREAEADESKP